MHVCILGPVHITGHDSDICSYRMELNYHTRCLDGVNCGQRYVALGQGRVRRNRVCIWNYTGVDVDGLKFHVSVELIIIIIIIIIWFGDTVTVTHPTKCNTNSKVRAMSA